MARNLSVNLPSMTIATLAARMVAVWSRLRAKPPSDSLAAMKRPCSCHQERGTKPHDWRRTEEWLCCHNEIHQTEENKWAIGDGNHWMPDQEEGKAGQADKTHLD